MRYNSKIDLYFETENMKDKCCLSFKTANLWLLISGYYLCYENIDIEFLLKHSPYLLETIIVSIEELMEKKYLVNKKLTEKSYVSYNKRTSE